MVRAAAEIEGLQPDETSLAVQAESPGLCASDSTAQHFSPDEHLQEKTRKEEGDWGIHVSHILLISL